MARGTSRARWRVWPTTGPASIRWQAAALSAALALPTSGCDLLSSRTTTLLPKSDFGEISHWIFLYVLWWDLGILLLVEVLLLTAIIRFRERDPTAIPRQIRGDFRFELGWTIAPALILTFIAYPTVGAIFQTQAPPSADALRVRVIGHQWWWEFQYPALGVATASDLHLPAGRAVVLELSSPDVIHSFWVPQLGGKRDTVPGQTNRILMKPGRPGEYPGQCAEFCGVSHANMRHIAIIHQPAAFEAWVARQKAPPAEPAEGSPAAKGLLIFKAAACVGCHTIQGVSTGTLGPDLTHFASRKTVAGGILRLADTPDPVARENLARWLRNPPAVKPGSLMPDLKLSQAEVEALVAYLLSLK